MGQRISFLSMPQTIKNEHNLTQHNFLINTNTLIENDLSDMIFNLIIGYDDFII